MRYTMSMVTAALLSAVVLQGCGGDNKVAPINTNPASVPLGAIVSGSNSFRVLAGSTVANTGNTTVAGDVGVWAGASVTGFGPGTMTGNGGVAHSADVAAQLAQSDLTIAYNNAAGRAAGAAVAGNIGGQTLTPGVYTSASSLEISSGNLTLNGNSAGVFIFQIPSTLTVTAGRQVILTGGAQASNVYWQVGSSATLGTTANFSGIILANSSITLATGATLHGRALARVGGVALDSNIVGP
ncbi:MAG: ice-binding family protein [Candidatus Eisenbacteria bacterium]